MHTIHSHRTIDVLEVLLAQVLKCEVQPPDGILLDTRGHKDRAWIGECFETCRDVHPITEDVSILDNDITDMDTHSVLHAIIRSTGVVLAHPALHCDRTRDCLHDTGKLSQDAVAGSFDNPTLMFGNLRID
jgi:hypothetical protein